MKFKKPGITLNFIPLIRFSSYSLKCEPRCSTFYLSALRVKTFSHFKFQFAYAANNGDSRIIAPLSPSKCGVKGGLKGHEIWGH